MNSDAFDLVIVGDGLAAAVLITRVARRRVPVHVAVIGDRGAVGHGRAYSEPASTALINAPVSAMAIPDVTTFDEWLRTHRPAVHRTGADYVPRQLFGDYASHQFTARQVIEATGGSVTVVVDHANRLDRVGHNLWRVRGSAGTDVVGQRVSLCVGTAEADSAGRPLVTTPGYIEDPYPLSGVITRIPTGAAVATIGAGLSAIDVALTLRERAPTSSVVMTSRSGMLPTIRGEPSRKIDLYSRSVSDGIRTDEPVDLDRYAALIDRCVVDASCADDEWRGLGAILASSAGPLGTSGTDLASGDIAPAGRGLATAAALLRATGSQMWQRIGPAERARFNAEWRPGYRRLCNPMPMRSATVLAAMASDNALVVLADPAVRLVEGGYRITTGSTSLHAQTIVNTSGFSRTQIPSNARALVGRLTSQGQLENSLWGGIRVCGDTPSALVDAEPSCEIFVLGQMASGERFLSNSIGAMVADSDHVADILERSLRARVSAP